MDTATTRPQLPSLGFVNLAENAYQSRKTGLQQPSAPTTAEQSPTVQGYPLGPPPPYSQPAPTSGQDHSNQHSRGYAGPGTPPNSRRTSSEEKDASIQITARQSLPSISEALGVDNQVAYQSSALPAHATSIKTTAAPPSPNSRHRAYAMDPPHLPSPVHSSYGHSTSAPSLPPCESVRPAFGESRSLLHSQTTQSPPTTAPGSYAHPPTSKSPVFDRPPPPSQPTAPPSTAPSTFPYGYAPYQPRYTQSPSAPNTSAGAIYQPSSVQGPPTAASPTWKAGGSASRYGDERTYGDSVKRHLDLYDLEAALNDIASTSSILGDFSRRYGDRLHQTPRTGPSFASLPGIIEVEDMISKSRLQTEALIKIREVVLAQQAAYDQQAAEQRQHTAYAEPMANSIAHESEDKAGFGGSEIKKRRGRAAPPGRCHSCNRAETPEWRRGPDGARTLCNACGLHYAKLTRKQNNANKSGGMSSSNLRPKENLP